MNLAQPSTSDAEAPMPPMTRGSSLSRGLHVTAQALSSGPSRQGESCAEPPSSQASLPTSGPWRNTVCSLNEWMRAPHNDSDDDEEEELKGAEIQVSVPDSGICVY